jgi:exonuclease VII small subunit
MRLSEVINAFRTGCDHNRESERLLGAAKLEVQQFIGELERRGNAATPDLT